MQGSQNSHALAEPSIRGLGGCWLSKRGPLSHCLACETEWVTTLEGWPKAWPEWVLGRWYLPLPLLLWVILLTKASDLPSTHVGAEDELS